MNTLLLLFIFLYPTLMSIGVFFKWFNNATILIQTILTMWLVYILIKTQKSESKWIYFSQLSKRIHLFLFIFLMISIVSITRGYLNDQFNLYVFVNTIVCLIFFYCVGLLTLVENKNQFITKNKIFSALYLGIVFYAIINLVLFYGFNIKSPLEMNTSVFQDSVIGHYFGLKRLILPLSGGFGATHLGSILGIVVVDSSIRIMYFRNANWISSFNIISNYISSVICIITLVMVDARAAFFSVIFVLVYFFFINIKKAWFIFNLKYTYLILIVSYLFIFLSDSISNFLEPLFNQLNLNRGNTSTFTDREVIWDSAKSFFSDFNLEQLIGYGMWGQYENGIFINYQSVFAYDAFYNENAKFSLHSTILQQLVDIGYLGLLTYITLTLLSIKSLVRLIKFDADKSYVDYVNSISSIAILMYFSFVGNFDPVSTQQRIFTLGIYTILIMSSIRKINLNDSSIC